MNEMKKLKLSFTRIHPLNVELELTLQLGGQLFSSSYMVDCKAMQPYIFQKLICT